jgi:hypothetical protein
VSLIDFATLAAIPREHLRAGSEVAMRMGFVPFGSFKFELFRKVDDMVQGERVPVILDPSHETAVVHTSFRVTWCGWYVGHVETYDEKLNDERSGHRPPTTQQYENDNAIG